MNAKTFFAPGKALSFITTRDDCATSVVVPITVSSPWFAASVTIALLVAASRSRAYLASLTSAASRAAK